ncbi:DUF86 domain-containing protein [Sediminibacillus massiliensis]|uniref:DUF86 domain-containing protein n=1 Tax=Sediminibacillus massiliensis TaxID=1926277 RepID=UPI0009884327|nr:DUF86 domain-containing protein [Sediminibacillus massiliensis]
MYFVDRNKIEQHLLYMDGLLREFDQHSFESFLEKLSLERISHMWIESLLDVGNMIIDGFIMRDPGSFTDIIDILVDEEVLPAGESDAYKEVIQLRKMLVKDYLNLDHQVIVDVMKRNQYSLEMFSTRINDYLDGESGVANAFSNQ